MSPFDQDDYTHPDDVGIPDVPWIPLLLLVVIAVIASGAVLWIGGSL